MKGHNRTMARSNSKALAPVNYEHVVQEHIRALVDGQIVQPPKANTAVSALIQRYYFSRVVAAYAKKLCDQLRQELEESISMPTNVGKYVLRDDTLVFCEAWVKEPAYRLDESKVFALLVSLGYDEIGAKQLLEQCYTANKAATQISVTLKR
jgi:hypothetical protein